MFAGFVWAAHFMILTCGEVSRKTFRRHTGIAPSISAFHLETVDHVSYERKCWLKREYMLVAHRTAVVFANPLRDAAVAEHMTAMALHRFTQNRAANDADQLLIGHRVIVFQCKLWDCTVRGYWENHT